MAIQREPVFESMHNKRGGKGPMALTLRQGRHHLLLLQHLLLHHLLIHLGLLVLLRPRLGHHRRGSR